MTSIHGLTEGQNSHTIHHSEVAPPTLTRNQQMVYSAMLEIKRSVKAYELLDILRPQGVKAAPTVYRALNELAEKGLIQHLVSSRSFTVLESPNQSPGQKIIFVCEDCGETVETENSALVSALDANAHENGFKIRRYHLEISTSCGGCKNESAMQ